MIFEVIFDLETKKLFSDIKGSNPGDLGVSVVSIYTRKLDKNLNEAEGKIISFWEKDFENMWPYFQNADRIIGFNSLGFDVPALKPHSNFPFQKLSHFDIMDSIKNVLGHRLSLNAIAMQTLGAKKSDVGTNAVLYWQKGDKKSLEKLQKYCEADVIITKNVYDFGLKNKHLKYKDKWNTIREVEIDFSHPPQNASSQSSLF